jgi:hypothetical protein
MYVGAIGVVDLYDVYVSICICGCAYMDYPPSPPPSGIHTHIHFLDDKY